MADRDRRARPTRRSTTAASTRSLAVLTGDPPRAACFEGMTATRPTTIHKRRCTAYRPLFRKGATARSRLSVQGTARAYQY